MATVQIKDITEDTLSKCLKCGTILLQRDVSLWLSFVLQLLQMTDVTDTQTVQAVLPIQTGANGVTTRSAFQQTVTVAWWVSASLWSCY